MEAVFNRQTSDHRRLSKRIVSNRTSHPEPSNRSAHLLFAPAAANPYPPHLPLGPHSYPPPNNRKNTQRPNNWSSSKSTPTSVPVPVPSSLTPKKSSPKSKHRSKKETAVSAAAPFVGSTASGPVPLSTKGNPPDLNSGKQEADGFGVEFSCPSVYSLAPPPSSLPLPSFALRPKLGCNVAAAAAGASALLLHPPSMKTNV